MEEIKKSNLSLECRKKLSLTGVQEIISFDEEQVLLSTNLGSLDVKGSDLKVNKLDVQNGDVIIMGTITSMVYSNKEALKSKENLFKKLFQ